MRKDSTDGVPVPASYSTLVAIAYKIIVRDIARFLI